MALEFEGEMSTTVTPPSGPGTSAKSTFKGRINAALNENAEVASVESESDFEV